MDTREKIRSLDDFIAREASQPWTAALGVFDPVTADVVRYIASLAGIGRKLLVVVGDRVGDGEREQGSVAFLSVDGRARILASLRVVDAVVIAPAAEAKNAFEAARIDVQVEEDPGFDRRCSDQFIQHVLDRQASVVAQKP